VLLLLLDLDLFVWYLDDRRSVTHRARVLKLSNAS
jgi:hypothetical protein